MTRIPWPIGTAGFLAVVACLSLAVNYLLGDYFIRTFIDEADPLAGLALPSEPRPGEQTRTAGEVVRGEIRDGEPGHTGRGSARILRASDGKYTLRLENFSVTNGPDLLVYLSTSPDSFEEAGAVNLGDLKATDGNQNYEIPAQVDVSRYRSVIIWCRQFRVNFAYATLGSPPPGPTQVSPVTPAGTATVQTPVSSSPTSTPVPAPTNVAGPAASATAPLGQLPAATPTATPTPTAPPPTPVSAAGILAQGTFRDGEPGHTGKGSARLIRDAQGALFLRLEDFSVTNGPDLRVYLTTTGGYDGERLDLGKLKATDGNQNYPIPAGTDVSKFRSVLIWCEPFRVLFAIATLGGN